MANDRLAQYTVLEKIGEGGMGEVFRARDTRLGRDVALKFLPETLARDTERLARFEREAQVLASLNHPNIATIHGFEHVDDRRFLVLELVEGEDLSQRLARGALTWQEAVPLARQVAEALEAAHEVNIVHRDLKPANILITPSGTAKVLDFGLAKSWESDSVQTSLTNSPTILSNSPSMTGVIMGTAAYMSPEQARGHPVDKRADIFAFGCVLFEMLTGKPCFGGSTVSDILAAVLRAEPDWAALPQDLPKPILQLLRRCLDKEPRTRLRDIGEARICLESVLRGEIDEPAGTPETAVPVATHNHFGSILGWLLAVAFAVASGSLFMMMRSQSVESSRIMRTSVLPSENVRFNLRGVHPGPVAISPGGERIAYAGIGEGGQAMLYIRDLDHLETRLLRGTEGAGYPFWSPDGRSVGFFAGGKLKRVDMTGGPPRNIADAPVGKGGSWNVGGEIVFAPTFAGPLLVVSENGGATRPVTELRSEQGENSHRFPQFLDDDVHFLYLVRHGGEANRVRVGSLSGDVDKEVLQSGSQAVFGSDHLLYLQASTLLARRFDQTKLACVGDPISVADPVRFIPAAMRGVFDLSRNGILVYQPGATVLGSQFVWRNRKGEELGRIGEPRMQDSPSLSRDGRFIAYEAFSSSGGTGDIWIHDIERGVPSRFTFDLASDENAVWSPDDKQIAFSSARDGRFGIYIKDVGGAANAELFLETPGMALVTDWSRDYLVFYATDSLNTGNIMAVPTQGEHKAVPVMATPYGEYNGVVSADGHWLAFISDESGRFETYVTSFPVAERKWQISSGGGNEPRWDPLGRGLYYNGNGQLLFVEAEWDDENFAVGPTTVLFQSGNMLGFQVAPDGERFLALEDFDKGGQPLAVVLNWDKTLDRND
jgi:Tol biopolymer transport system component